MTTTSSPATPKAEVTTTRTDRVPDLTSLTVGEINDLAKVFYAAKTFKNVESQAEALVKILAGQELGVPPIQAMNGIHMVDGKPALSASLVGSLVKRSGRYNFREIQSNDSEAVIEWSELVSGEWVVRGKSEYTRLEAEQAGLFKPRGGRPSVWMTYAGDMLFARALTRGARRFCPDVFGGAVYTSEEPREMPDETEAFEQGRQRFSLPSVPRSADAGDAHTSVVDDPDQPPQSGPAASAQGGGSGRRRMGAATTDDSPHPVGGWPDEGQETLV